MREALNFWVLGGDMRQGKLAQLLAEDGHRVHTYALEEGAAPAGELTAEEGLEGAAEADCVVLPLPVSDGEGRLNCPLSRLRPPLAEVLEALSPGQMVCGGRVDPVTAALAAERGLTVLDYLSLWPPGGMSPWPGPRPWATGRRRRASWRGGCAAMTWW